VAGAALLAAALALTTPAEPALANGTPIRITLRFLNGVTNFGPQNSTGTAEMITSEGEVRLLAAGLDTLPPDEEYQVWIQADSPSTRMRLGTVQVNDSGVGRLDTVLREPIPELHWSLMVITVEKKGAQGDAPSEKRAIAGRPEMPTGAGEAPRVLPNTGGTVPGAGGPSSGVLGMSNGGTVLLLLLVVGVVGFALGRTKSGRRA
jgi:hypothetical protein